MRRAAALTAIVAVLGGTLAGGAAPVAAQTDPTRLWSEYPLNPAPPRGSARAASPSLTPSAMSEPTEDEKLATTGLVLLFVVVAGGTLVGLSVFALRWNERRSWY
jgi:hypothetical protein